jgi:hypothetical protein
MIAALAPSTPFSSEPSVHGYLCLSEHDAAELTPGSSKGKVGKRMQNYIKI